ncbi:hypothetical protein LXL04_035793 [Taraxacum kok-saghyz]
MSRSKFIEYVEDFLKPIIVLVLVQSCLLFGFSDGSFTTSVITAIGFVSLHPFVFLSIRTIALDGKQIKLQIWDTTCQGRFRAITAGNH